PEENYGLGDRVARFSKVAKQINIVEIDILSLATNEQSRTMERRGNIFVVLASDNTNWISASLAQRAGGSSSFETLSRHTATPGLTKLLHSKNAHNYCSDVCYKYQY
ncbi:MAG: hypothetical protein KAS16_03140, partial [Thermoplasmata archaeon]|nr:hypothetical protein [Thermoplasmata archaeon]